MELSEDWKSFPFEQIVDLYKSVNWSIYANDQERLRRAFENSAAVVLAIENENVIGVARSISDGVSIHYLQDILVHPNHQRKGVGRKLFEKVLEIFKDVRTHMLLTDDEERQSQFYHSLGFKNTKSLQDVVLNSYVKIKDTNIN